MHLPTNLVKKSLAPMSTTTFRAEGPAEINFAVYTRDAGTHHVVVDANANVREVKVKIRKQTGVSIDRQELFCNGKQLQDNQRLSDLGIKRSANIFLSINARSSALREKHGNEITICISDTDKTEYIFTIDPSRPVYDLKIAFWSKVKMKKTKKRLAMDLINFVYSGTVLRDDRKLSDYNLGSQKIVYMFVALKSEKKQKWQWQCCLPRESQHVASGSASAMTVRNEQRAVKVLHATSSGMHDCYMVVDPTLSVNDLRMEYVKVARKHTSAGTETQQLLTSSFYTLKFSCDGRVLRSTERVRNFAREGQTTQLVVTAGAEAARKAMALSSAEQTIAHQRESSTFQNRAKQAKQTLPERSSLGNRRCETYHNIDKLAEEHTSGASEASVAYTANVLQEQPTGELELGDDVATPLHILRNLFSQNNEEVEFYDSRKGMELMDSSTGVQDLFLKDKPMILRLHNLQGLAGADDLDMSSSLAEIQAAIELSICHPVLEDVKMRLSESLNVPAERIRFTEVFQGSACFQYTVNDLSTRERQTMIQEDTSGHLRAAFQGFQSLQVHPLLFRSAFDVALFDTRGNKSFLNEGDTFQVGPPGMEKTYTQPLGWVRYGLRVLTENAREDAWLHPFGDNGNWWRAFHGTANAGKYMEGVNANDPKQMQNASLDAMAGIHKEGFEEAKVAAYGPGVYCSPSPTFVEENFAARVPLYLEGRSSPKWFKVMLQVGVRPADDTLTDESTDEIWAVQRSEWIRSYGILFKEDED